MLIHQLLRMTPPNADIDANAAQLVAKQLSHLFTPETVMGFFESVSPPNNESTPTSSEPSSPTSAPVSRASSFLAFFGGRKAIETKAQTSEINSVNVDRLALICEVII